MNEKIVLAGGCFWGMEELFRTFSGVVETKVGYTGGATDNPVYNDVKTGQTGHAEALKIVFDSDQTSLTDVLRFFFKIHDPTTVNRQGNDIGTQYRSTIFFRDDKQRETARTIIEEVNNAGKWPNPVATTLEIFDTFYLAEDFHQDYLLNNPNGYTCHFIRE